MNVSAIVVTRGDVPIEPIFRSLPDEWQKLEWDNGAGRVREWSVDMNVFAPYWQEKVRDVAVYGRYAAIEFASHDLIYVQDDDCIVSDPQAIVNAYYEDMLVCNMPEPWRSNPFYEQHALVGFGAAFHRDMPKRAFDRVHIDLSARSDVEWFNRTCDVAFTYLTPKVLVDVPHASFNYAWHDNRMWRQPEHQVERDRMLQKVGEIRGR